MKHTAPLSSDLVSRFSQAAALPADNDNSSRKHPRRRGLVLTDEGATHPFRTGLPPRIRRELHDIPAESLWRLTIDDVRGFASVYLAATAGLLAFIV